MTHRRRVRNIVKNGTVSVGGGTLIGGADGLLIKESALSLKISNTDTLAAKTETNFIAISVINNETITGSEAIKLSISGTGLNETNNIQTETNTTSTRYWASASTDNDSSKTTPTNANGQNNATIATIKTNLSLGDLANPVVLTSTTFGTPGSGTFTSKKIRAYFSIGARTVSLDTIVLQYKIGAGAPVAFYTHSGTAAVNNSVSGLVVDVSSLTLTQLTTISLIASYRASIVAVPETSITLDAWAIELEQ